MSKPRILWWDIETSLQLAAIFQLAHNDYINPDSLVTERYVICAAWQWNDSDEVESVSVADFPKTFKADPYDDKKVITKLHEVLSEADVLVHHNGDSFDKKWIDTRILLHGLPALPPVHTIDTYKVAKQRFYLNSNKLDYIGKFLGVGEKAPTSKGLWMRVLNGEKAAVEEMVEYNKHDVVLLKDIFEKLKPYINNYPNLELFGDDVDGCPRCGSIKIQSRGVHRAITRTYQRYCCNECGGWFRRLRADEGSVTTTRII